MTEKSIKLEDFFQFTPTESQHRLIRVFDDYMLDKKVKKTLIIKGYAGTGKTQCLDTIANYLSYKKIRIRLLAPTGKAAKVIEKYTGRNAYTIHSQIFTYKFDKEASAYISIAKENNSSNTVFIVDEASMVSSVGYGGGLLNQLIEFVFSGVNNSLILIGDDAQLPPVGLENSYSLDADFLANHYNITPYSVELLDVTRQGKTSGILLNANILRNMIFKFAGDTDIGFDFNRLKDVYSISKNKMEDGLRYAYDKFGVNSVMVLARSNWETVRYNEFIRHSLLFFENEIDGGDILLVTKNNYYYDLDSYQGSFIANGNLLSVKRVIDDEVKFGFRFATLELYFLDNMNDSLTFEAKVCLDTLHEVSKVGDPSVFELLREKIEESYSDIISVKERERAIKEDEYYNALYVKYAYALTVHKSQGGQWDAVFLDTAYMRQQGGEGLTVSYLRWLYTGFTRAQRELYLLGMNL